MNLVEGWEGDESEADNSVAKEMFVPPTTLDFFDSQGSDETAEEQMEGVQENEHCGERGEPNGDEQDIDCQILDDDIDGSEDEGTNEGREQQQSYGSSRTERERGSGDDWMQRGRDNEEWSTGFKFRQNNQHSLWQGTQMVKNGNPNDHLYQTRDRRAFSLFGGQKDKAKDTLSNMCLSHIYFGGEHFNHTEKLYHTLKIDWEIEEIE